MPPTWTGMETGMEGERIHPKGAPGLLFQQSSPSWYPVCIQAAQATVQESSLLVNISETLQLKSNVSTEFLLEGLAFC